MEDIADRLRQIGITSLDPGGGYKAHQILDEMLREINSASVKPGELHIADIGVPERLANQFGLKDIHTLQDLCNCDHVALAKSMNLLDILKVMRMGLKRAIDLARAG